MSVPVRLQAFLIVLLPFSAGCQHLAPPTTLFGFVDPAHHRGPTIDASKYKITEEAGAYVDAKPIEPLVSPKYPPIELGAQKWPVTMTVTIKVGTDGIASYVGPSMAAVSMPTQFDQQFLEAIKASLSQWRFEPAHLIRLAPRQNEPPIIVDLTDVDTTLDVAFTFSPGGTVTSSKPNQDNRNR
jgi:hypothetical protein